MEGLSTLEAGEHLVILVATAALLLSVLQSRTGPVSRPMYLLVGAIAGVPVVLGVLPDAAEQLVTSKEGVLEALTAGVLLCLVVLAWRVRSPWVVLGAGLILLEELDYGQALLGFVSPAALEEAGSSSGNFNSHSLPSIEVLWRVVPLAVVVLLATRGRWPARWNELADRLRLPRLDPGLLVGLVTLVGSALVTWWFVGERRADEAGELAAVALVAVAWWSSETTR